MEQQTIIIAFALTLFAGLSTGIGGAIAFFAKTTNTKLLSMSLGFSAGVMLYVSFVEILSKSKISLIAELGDYRGYFITIVSFFGGIFIAILIDTLVPSFANPHVFRKVEEITDPKMAKRNKKLFKMGVFSAVAIAIHNFPEGIATFTAAIGDIRLGVFITIAIAIHNIPEGIAVSIPIYYATGNKKKAFFYSFLSGLSEPLGAVIGFFIFTMFMTPIVFGVVFASVAGIMVYIAVDELLPTARECGKHTHSIYGLIAGMMVMAFSLLFLQQ